MILPRYAEYKESGAAWLGQIPSSWDVRRVKSLFEIRKRIAGEEGYEVLSITQRGLQIKDVESNDGQLSMDYSKYQLVEPGDFAMNHMDLLTGYVDLSKISGVTSPDYRVFSLRSRAVCCDRYFLYLFQNAYHRRIFYAFGQGASHLGRWRLPAQQFNNFLLPLPSLEEQTAIADFLDGETARIDELLLRKRELLTKIEEELVAIVARAVTKGLPSDEAVAVGLAPNPTLKDTGVDWLGEVPEHWEVLQLKWAVRFQRGHDLPSEKREEGDIPVVSSAGIIGKHSVSAAKGPGIVTGRYGSIGQFYLIKEDYWPLNTTLYSTSLRGNDPRFLVKMLENLSPLFLLNAVKSAVPGVDRNDIHPVLTAIPPLVEQSAIADTCVPDPLKPSNPDTC